jgi:hypothetical protein
LTHFGRADSRVRELAGIPQPPEALPTSPEVDLTSLKDDFTAYRLLEEIARRGKINLVGRTFRPPPLRAPMERPAYVRRGPALEIVAEMARVRQLFWGVDGDWLLLSPQAWPFIRQKQIPDALLDRWLEAAEKEQLGLEHVMEMALLPDLQLEYLQSFLWPAVEAHLYREGLRVWARLTPLQRRAAQDPRNGLPVERLAPDARDRIYAATGVNPDLRLFATADADTLRVRLATAPGGGQDLVRVRRPVPAEYYSSRFEQLLRAARKGGARQAAAKGGKF